MIEDLIYLECLPPKNTTGLVSKLLWQLCGVAANWLDPAARVYVLTVDRKWEDSYRCVGEFGSPEKALAAVVRDFIAPMSMSGESEIERVVGDVLAKAEAFDTDELERDWLVVRRARKQLRY